MLATLKRRLIAPVLVLLAGCGEGDVLGPDVPPDVRPYATGAAAQSIGPDGLFILPIPTAPSTSPIISAARARDLAASYVRSFGPSMKRWWDEDRGRPIDLARLQPGTRTYYADTPYEPFPDGFHPAFGRSFGPYYHVWIFDGSTPVLLVTVGGYNAEIAIDSAGLLKKPPLSGMEFVSHGIPARTPSLWKPLTPEEAVVRVGRATRARVSEVPEMVQVGMRRGPVGAVWKLSLDRPVTVRVVGTGRMATVQEIYAGPDAGAELLVPALDQPATYETLAARISPDGEDLGPELVHVSVRLGAVTKFEGVTIP